MKTTEDKLLGKCIVCGKPFLIFWKDMNNNKSQVYTDNAKGRMHFECTNGKSLQLLNEERNEKNNRHPRKRSQSFEPSSH
jgi:hypothetical protein